MIQVVLCFVRLPDTPNKVIDSGGETARLCAKGKAQVFVYNRQTQLQ
jgi:hypothetical protein